MELVVTKPSGEEHNSGVSALVVPLEDPPLWRHLASLWIPELPSFLAEQKFRSGAGDSLQESARLSAWHAVQKFLGKDLEVGAVLTGKPLNPLKDGDLIVQIDGRPVLGGGTAQAVFNYSECGEKRRVKLVRDSEKMVIDLPCDYLLGDTRLVTSGLELAPLEVQSLDGIKGPSVGLPLALAYLQALLPGSLTNGLTVAATGQVVPRSGKLRPDMVVSIGSIAAKMQAARSAGVDLVLVPESQVREARLHAGETPVVGVTTVEDAVEYLCSRGATSAACKLVKDE